MAKRIIIMTDIRKPNSAAMHRQTIVKEARGVFRILLSIEKQGRGIGGAIGMGLVNAHAVIAFEAHGGEGKAEGAKSEGRRGGGGGERVPVVFGKKTGVASASRASIVITTGPA